MSTPIQPHNSEGSHPQYPTTPQPTAGSTSGATYPQQNEQGQPYRASAQVARPQQATTMGQTNTFAVLAIIFAFVAPLAGIIFGHLSLNQIKRNGDAGRGIGLTGLIISYAYFLIIAFFVIFYIGMMIMMFGAMGAAFSEFDSLDSDLGTY